MILPITQYGNPVLRVQCAPVEQVDDSLKQLVADMLETMYEANGIGLAAPQVGHNIRLVVIDIPEDEEEEDDDEEEDVEDLLDALKKLGDALIKANVTEVYEIEAGETVYDILVEAARKHSLHLDATGVGDAMYVRGIGHLYEMEHGDLSGWNYKVNGNIPSMGCAAYTLSDGDVIVWEYTLTVGK